MWVFNMKCDKCGLELQLLPVRMSYLEHEFSEKLPACPGCGMVFISEDLVNDKILKVEEAFEEK